MTYQIIENGLTLDDVLLQPKYSTIASRSQVDLSVKVGSINFSHPIIPANMQTICGEKMAIAVMSSYGFAILHRFMEPAEQVKIAKSMMTLGIKNPCGHFAASIGVKASDKEMVEQFYKVGVRNICIDVAHGDSELCLQMISWIKANYSDMFVIAGNVATSEGAYHLWRGGADMIRCGIGNGGLCSTRIETGNGVPQLSALIDVFNAREQVKREGLIKRPLYIISDGGVKSSGDIVKCLCFADMVMTGSLFSGCVETPSQTVSINGTLYKEYVGSSTHKTNHIEGIATLVGLKGTYKSVLDKLLEGVRSGCSYQNARNLEELRQNPVFIKMTNNGLIESHPNKNVLLK